jgi:tetratricopeptide (TPR) repeat protein
VNGLDTNSAILEIYWENSRVALKFEVPTQKSAMASIEKVLAGPAAADYFAAAQFYYQSTSDTNKARTYIDKALELSVEKPFYFLRLRSLIQAKQGDKKAAIETAKLSIKAAEAAGNNDYIKMNKESISEWSK